ncbi:MAG: hypothetical protein IJJ14_04400, partial [Coriobacteriales bacterium]|nr:hypothetical protein [Coriobacteriales bacterium]
DDHGRPDTHPHDANGGHNHDWVDGKRGAPYVIDSDVVVGAFIVSLCAIGLVVVTANDAVGIGVLDDFLYAPLGAGFSEGMIMIFG